MTRCSAITKAGKQCSVTSNSSWIDNNDRVVAEPLRRGGEFCALHAKPFCTKPTQMDDYKRLVIFILDLETTGTDISQDRIVEIAAAHCHDDIRMSGEAFSTTARVDPDILMTRTGDVSSLFFVNAKSVSAEGERVPPRSRNRNPIGRLRSHR